MGKASTILRTYAGHNEILGADEHRALAREAVSQSLVLLKNKENILPLSTNQKYLVLGSAANDIQKQTGGWTLTWQGTENEIERDFPGAQTMLMALQELVGEENIITDINQADEDTTAIVIFGEDPYAEMFGDIKRNQTLEYATIKAKYAEDLELIRSLEQQGNPVVSVFYSGRPLYVNEEINLSDAFVAAWLPGTEAGGITDVLFAQNGRDFSGKLSYSWPKKKCSTTINRHAPNIEDYVTPETEQDIEGEHKPLFPYGYGLSYGNNNPSEDLDNLPLDPREFGCGQDEPDDGIATDNLEIFGRSSSGEFVARMSGDNTGWAPVEVSNGSETSIGNLTTKPINYMHQQDAINVVFSGEGARQLYMQTYDEKGEDRNSYLNADATLQFDIDVKKEVPDNLILSMHCEWPCFGEVEIGKVLPKPLEDTSQENWQTIKVPLQCLADNGMSFPYLNTAFLLYSNEPAEFEFNLGEIRFVPRSIDPAEDALTCEELAGDVLPPLDQDVVDVPALWQDLGEYKVNTDNWQGIEGHMSYGWTSEETLRVSYDSQSPESYKGIVFVQGTSQNLENYLDGTLEFDLFVESYGQPANSGENATQGLVIKMESPDGPGNDLLLPRADYPIGVWHRVSVPVKDLNTGNLNIQNVHAPLAMLPFWSASQAGFVFEVKNIELVK